jgi:hypothetical protein
MRTRTRVIRTVGAALLAVPLALAAVAGPAGAGDDPLEEICGMSPHEGDADGRVAPHTLTSFAGVGIWNVTADGQVVLAAIAPGSVAEFDVFYENTDDATHDIVIRGDLDLTPPPPGFGVKAFRSTNGKDVTNKVFGLAGLRMKGIAAEAGTPNLLIRIRMKGNANPNAFIDAFLTGNYGFASACGDTVRVGGGGL